MKCLNINRNKAISNLICGKRKKIVPTAVKICFNRSAYPIIISLLGFWNGENDTKGKSKSVVKFDITGVWSYVLFQIKIID